MPAIGVIVAITDARESDVVAALGADRRMIVARRCADIAEALAAAEAGIGSVVVVGEQAHLHRATVNDFAAMGVRVVGVPDGDGASERLASIGVAVQVGDVGTGLADAVAALATASASDGSDPGGSALQSHDATVDAPPEPTRSGQIVSVWGPVGAPGRTLVATSLAAEIARTGRDVVLVDADTYGAAVAQTLGLLEEAAGLAAVARASRHGSLSPEAVSTHALDVAPHLRVLTGVTRADRWPELAGGVLEPVWELLRTQADTVVIDAGFGLETDEYLSYDTRAPQRNGATISALAAADAVVAVGSADPVGIQRLIHGLDRLATVRGAASAAPMVVVNKIRADVAGSRPEEAVADALARYARVERVWPLPWDPRACDAAMLAGRTLAERVPRSRVRRALERVAAALLADLANRRAASDAPEVAVTD